MGYSDAVAQLGMTSGMLDTRGLVHLRLGNLRAARRDLQAAVEASDALHDHAAWLVEALRHGVVDLRELELREHQLQYTRAVIYYHQMQVHAALGMTRQADQDRAKIVELGFEPGDDLM